MTQHPNQRERAAIQASADAGDESARNYLALLDARIHVLQELLDVIEDQTISAILEIAPTKIGTPPDLVKIEEHLDKISRAILELKRLEGVPSLIADEKEVQPPQ